MYLCSGIFPKNPMKSSYKWQNFCKMAKFLKEMELLKMSHWDRPCFTGALFLCRVRSHWAKANMKAKFFFDVWNFFFDLLRSFFDLLCFCVSFRSVWTGLKSHSQFLISAKILGSICTWRQRCVFSVVRCEQIHWWQCNPSLTTWLQRQKSMSLSSSANGPLELCVTSREYLFLLIFAGYYPCLMVEFEFSSSDSGTPSLQHLHTVFAILIIAQFIWFSG